MNITRLFNFLKEDMEINKFNKAVEGKISSEILNAFASRMKKGKYNNISLAILKGIQAADERHRAALEKDYAKAYAVLRQMAKGNSSFNAGEIINEYLGSNNPETFWRDKYIENKAEKPADPSFGLKDARVKELENYYLFFPKTFYDELYFGKQEDFEKGWQELKAISDEMAKKDTSGKNGANVNHWCVASSSLGYYKSYKKRGGIFVVVIKKNKDGSPDWNNRYLWYYGKYYDMWKKEFADKFDKHLAVSSLKDNELSKTISKIKTSFLINDAKTDDIRNEFDRRRKEALKNLITDKRFTNVKRKNKELTDRVEDIKGLSESIRNELVKNFRPSLEQALPELKNGGDIVEGFKKRGEKKDTTGFGQKFTKYIIHTPYANYTLFGSGKTIEIDCTNIFNISEKIGSHDKDELKQKLLRFFKNLPENSSYYLPAYLSREPRVIKNNPDYSELNNNINSEKFLKSILNEESLGLSLLPFMIKVEFKNDWAEINNKKITYDDPDFLHKIKEEWKKAVTKKNPKIKINF